MLTILTMWLISPANQPINQGKNKTLKMKTPQLLAAALVAACLVLPAFAQTPALFTTPDKIETRLGTLGFDHGLPTTETRQKLYDQLDFQRAVQGVLWAEPAINNALFQRAMQEVGVPNLGAMIYNQRMQPGQETLTPNQAVVYLYDSINLKDTGPVVYINPPGPINAGFFDMWMRSVYDFGIVGPNKGKGDRILIVPPGYTGKIPKGYQVAYPKTYQLFTITRLTVKEGMTEKQGTELLQKIQTYRLSDVAKPTAKGFVLMGDPAKGGKEFRMNRPVGLDYWKMLHGIINAETVEDRDRMTLADLATISIERDKPFAPDVRVQKILVEGQRILLAALHPGWGGEGTLPRHAVGKRLAPALDVAGRAEIFLLGQSHDRLLPSQRRADHLEPEALSAGNRPKIRRCLQRQSC